MHPRARVCVCLQVLDECAELLYAEVQLRSSGGGLSLRIQGRLKSLHSVYRKMVRKGCSVAEVRAFPRHTHTCTLNAMQHVCTCWLLLAMH